MIWSDPDEVLSSLHKDILINSFDTVLVVIENTLVNYCKIPVFKKQNEPVEVFYKC